MHGWQASARGAALRGANSHRLDQCCCRSLLPAGPESVLQAVVAGTVFRARWVRVAGSLVAWPQIRANLPKHMAKAGE